jgi:phosphatidylglycerol:prolipoprotein diacylglycerol transferase
VIRFTDAGLQFLDLTLSWYGLCVVGGVWLAALIATQVAKRQQLNPDHVWQALIPAAAFGVVGARLWFVLFPPQSVTATGRTAAWMLTHILDVNQGAIAVWTGGLGLFGGLIGGVGGVWVYCRLARQAILPWLDIAALVAPVAVAVGRLGNGLNQEHYGPATDLPWGVLVSREAQRVAPYTDLSLFPLEGTRFHPVFAYEAMLCLTIFGVLWGVWAAQRGKRQPLQPGDLTLFFVVLYGWGRFLLEFWRVNVSFVALPLVGWINISQAAALGAAVISMLVLIRRQVISARWEMSAP